MTVHQVCGKVVDQLMQNAAREKSYDNLTIVMIAFKGLNDYLSKKEITSEDSTQENHIKILEGAGDNSFSYVRDNSSLRRETSPSGTQNKVKLDREK